MRIPTYQTNMKITKTGESEVYFRRTIDHTFNINGKEIVVREYQTSELDDFDEPTIEEGYDSLTDLELEAVGENMTDITQLTKGDDLTIENYDN